MAKLYSLTLRSKTTDKRL